MSNKNDGGPAFARSATGSAETGQIDPGAEGMSYHDVAALMAMHGWLTSFSDKSRNLSIEYAPQRTAELLAKQSYELADAMLAERRRRYHEESEPPQTKEMDNDRPENDDY